MALPPSVELLAGCVVAVVLFAFGCATTLGSSIRTLAENLIMVLLTEGAILMVLRSPLDWMHLHGHLLTDWSLVLGTGLTLVGILLNHLAGRSRPTRRKHRVG